MQQLVMLGLMPDEKLRRKDLEVLNPYEPAPGISIQPEERRNDEETGEIKPKISELRAVLKDQTLGQRLYHRQNEGQSVRFRGLDGDLYADRAIYLHEFDAMREEQKDHHDLTD